MGGHPRVRGGRRDPVGHRSGHADVLHRPGDQSEEDPQTGNIRDRGGGHTTAADGSRRNSGRDHHGIRHGPVHLSGCHNLRFEHRRGHGGPEVPEAPGQGAHRDARPDHDHGGHRPGDHPVHDHAHHGEQQPHHRDQQPDRDDREHHSVHDRQPAGRTQAGAQDHQLGIRQRLRRDPHCLLRGTGVRHGAAVHPHRPVHGHRGVPHGDDDSRQQG